MDKELLEARQRVADFVTGHEELTNVGEVIYKIGVAGTMYELNRSDLRALTDFVKKVGITRSYGHVDPASPAEVPWLPDEKKEV